MSNLIFSPTMSFTLTPTAKTEQDVIVIGGGPAGLTAALYTARANANPLVLIGEAVGGQAATTHEIENYPGFPDGVGGAALAQQMQAQVERFGAQVQFDFATEVDFKAYPFKIKTQMQAYTAKAVIVSTGSAPRKLGVSGEDKFRTHGVSYCATCDGYFFKDKNVVVVGGGNSALDESLFLARLVNKITIIHRRDQLRADPVLQKRALENPKIEFVWNSVVEEILGATEANAVRVRNLKTGDVQTLDTGGVFIYIGHTPNTRLFAGQLELDQAGYIVTDRRQHTSVPGVLAAGDVQDPIFRQIVTAAGTGSAAAIEAIRFLDEQTAHKASFWILRRRQLMSDAVKHVSDAEFEAQVIKSKLPVVVDFWAPWCGPCRMLAPTIDELAQEYTGKVVFAKMNTDENPSTPGKYGIMSIPTLLLFKDGEIVERSIGLKAKPALSKLVNDKLLS